MLKKIVTLMFLSTIILESIPVNASTIVYNSNSFVSNIDLLNNSSSVQTYTSDINNKYDEFFSELDDIISRLLNNKSILFKDLDTNNSLNEIYNIPSLSEQEVSQISDDDIEAVISIVNIYRNKAGLSSLIINEELCNVAQIHSNSMAENDILQHDSFNGEDFNTRIKRNVSYEYSNSGENIAYGQKTPKEVVEAWMNSKGHRANILNPNFNKIGVAKSESKNGNFYWVQDFTN